MLTLLMQWSYRQLLNHLTVFKSNYLRSTDVEVVWLTRLTATSSTEAAISFFQNLVIYI